jgi:hypothetical protein
VDSSGGATRPGTNGSTHERFREASRAIFKAELPRERHGW